MDASISYRWAELDRVVKRYLRRAWLHRDSFSSGIVVPRSGAGGQPVALVGLALGILGLALALWLLSPTSNASSVAQGALFVGSVLLLAGSGLRALAWWRASSVASFLLVDPLRVWEVTPEDVFVRELDGPIKACCTHRLESGEYVESVIKVTLSTGTTTIEVADRDLARQCAAFLNAVAKSPGDDGVPFPATAIGVRAAAAARGEGRVRHALRSTTRVPEQLRAPRPGRDARHTARAARRGRPGGGSGGRRDPSYPAVPDEGLRLVLILGCVLVPAVLCAVYVLPPLRAYLRDEHAFDLALTSHPGLLEADAYLRDHPDGRHVEAVGRLRDTRRFELARGQAERERTPAPLRAYLAEPANSLHRHRAERLIDGYEFALAREAAERDRTPVPLRRYLADPANRQYRKFAQELIEGHYDSALNAYRRRPMPESADPDLVAGLIAVMQGARGASDPSLLVGLKGFHEAHLVFARGMVIPPGESVGESSVRSRERRVVAKLADALDRVLGRDLVRLREAGPNETPDIEIRYTASPSDDLYELRQGVDRPVHLVGILRKYGINSTVVFRGPGGTEHQGRLYAGPNQEIHYKSSSGEPSDEAYAKMLDSAFDNLASRLIGKLNLVDASDAEPDARPSGTR